MSLYSKVHTRNNVNTFFITKTLTLCSYLLMPLLTDYCIVYNTLVLTLYDPGGALKAPPPPPIFCPHAFNFGATILCFGDFFQKIV